MNDTETNQEAAQKTDSGEQQPELTAEQKADEQRFEDYRNLQSVGQHLEATKVALSLKALTPAEQTLRHALYDRVINTGGPLIVSGSSPWKIEEKNTEPNS